MYFHQMLSKLSRQWLCLRNNLLSSLVIVWCYFHATRHPGPFPLTHSICLFIWCSLPEEFPSISLSPGWGGIQRWTKWFTCKYRLLFSIAIMPLCLHWESQISDHLFLSGQLQVWQPTLNYVGLRILPKTCHWPEVPRKTNILHKIPVNV